MIPTNAIDLHFPIVALSRGKPKAEAATATVYGTAFAIAPGIFITAAHVWNAAHADGIVTLSRIPRENRPLSPYRIDDAEIFNGIDLAVMRCDDLRDEAVPFPLDFQNTLTVHEPVTAMGFPVALDAEWVSMIARGFSGTIVTRRELYHLRDQPPGYEVSFFAPQGLSGAPLVSAVNGAHRCYGYIVQQSTIGVGTERTPVGIAVDIKALLGIQSQIMGGPLAFVFDQEPRRLVPTPARRPGGLSVIDTSVEDWPDEPRRGD